ncbi:MAG TPA: tetratricopeptide repeat protein [Steroidobacteraceae bacterium]|nr:tetratricopeptide repeat protein [Steroidobacteraceae bacterium]
MPSSTQALIGSLLLIAAPAAWSLPSDQLPAPGASSAGASGAHNAAAVTAYNAGVATLKRADALDAKAAGGADSLVPATDAAARRAYGEARAHFEEATRRDPSLAEAWNDLGYSRRKLGDYEPALAAYAHALALKPDFPAALEYRGEAYLRLNRLEDAKQSYMDLFVSDRTVAGRFLEVMKRWVGTAQAHPPAGVDPGAVAALGKWVDERAHIAGETAALTRAGTAASWR